MTRTKRLAVCLALSLAGCQTVQRLEASGAEARWSISRIGLPGEGRGDYITVDPDANRLYVTHSSSIHILALDSLTTIAEVKGLTGAHGIALDRAHQRGFVTDGVPANQVVVFDLGSGEVLKRIPAGEKPDSILFDPNSGKVMAFNNDSASVTVIDPVAAEVVETIELPSGPEFSQTDGKGKVWVNLEGDNAIAVIDSEAMKLESLIPLGDCDGPAPLGFDAPDRRLFAGCGNGLMKVVDADSGTLLASLPVGEDPDGIVYDAQNKRIVVANRDGLWSIINQLDSDHYEKLADLPIDEYAKTIAIDPRTGRLFSSTADLIWPAQTKGEKRLPNAKSGSFRLIVVDRK